MSDDLQQSALDYHAEPIPGKIGMHVTKPADTQRDLSLAYSPGVAEPVRKIAANPEDAYRYTGKGNLVAVISNGTAILGLGNLGALASKPVMEGKALLFKRFSGLDAIDIEVAEEDPTAFIDTVARIACSFGGINLEDISAPECFQIEQQLIERCDIPIFHDDQHGTAIVLAAGLINALKIQQKKMADIRIVCLGAGAAAISCMRILLRCGALRENIFMLDSRGVITPNRESVNEYKAEFANDTDLRSLEDVCRDADVFIGLSGADLLKPAMLQHMAPRPIVFACSNPDPEIKPELAKETRSDIIMGTGRSDYSNQVNNVLGFPFIFRGALDVGARRINEEMKIAAVKSLAALAEVDDIPEEVLHACNVKELHFGPDYIIPKPMDPRLLAEVPAAVARAAVDSGTARKPYPSHYPLGAKNISSQKVPAAK